MASTQACPEVYLAPADIAKILNVHPSAVIRWGTRGTALSDGTRIYLKHGRLPGGIRIKREDVDAFLGALTADRLRPDAPAEPKPAPKAARFATMRTGLAAAGF